MEHTRLHGSTSIVSTAHDPETNTGEIKFTNGGHYRITALEGGPAFDTDAHDALRGAESVGKHFNANIRGKYAVTKVADDEQPF